MRIAAYSRVSTVRQALEGCSLEAQESRLRTYAEAGGHELVALEVDHGLSGKSMAKRPALCWLWRASRSRRSFLAA
jgi:DNA invertase Pin-like site-specific DNA recombinase